MSEHLPPVKIGLLGLGTVGCGTIDVLRRNADEIARRAGRPITVTRAVARDLERQRPVDLAGITLSTDPRDVIGDPDVDIVCELIGGTDPALGLVLDSIAAGKHVVTANKALIALHGNQVFDAAVSNNVMVAFEAAVAGGIPVIKALREALAGNKVEWLAGIINGTCNFILTEMRDKGRAFDDVLAEAPALGYAEADPSFDINGTDAAHKLTILASIAYGIPLNFEAVHVEGITGVAQEDVAFASEFGYCIRHLGVAARSEAGIELRVHPTLVPQRDMLASVDGVMNAVLVRGDAAGPMLFYGAGAGAEPTASAVVADVVDTVRAFTSDPENRVPHLAFQPHAVQGASLVPAAEVRSAYYLRLKALDQPGVLADVTRILADAEISIEAILQRQSPEPDSHLPVVILTHESAERAVMQAAAQIEALAAVTGPITRIRLQAFA